ncbi:hypothetical protein M2138_001805 [Dysgonomonadaceae bacterium PH5-43]|nr:hypothetical protein [Dysgonomonadaceae bacterium PH5-43]
MIIMKKIHLIVLVLSVLCSVSLSAQDKVTVKAKVNQADELEVDATGEPVSVGDDSVFLIKGGTSPYGSPKWEVVTGEEGKTHKVTVSDSNNCSATILVNVDGFSDVEEISFEESVNAYPNPTTDIVNIPTPSNEESVAIYIINAEGRVLFKKSIKPTGSTYTLTLASCPSGRYFIQVVGEATKTYSIIKK